MAVQLPFYLLLLLLPLFISSQHTDSDALTIFRLRADTHGILASNWSSGSSACKGRWVGVTCSPTTGRVTALSLPSLSLRGTLSPLSALSELRFLDLRDNRLNGSLLPLLLPYSLPDLKLLYLSRNSLTGSLPSRFPRRILRIDLSHNDLRGPIPSSFLSLPRLLSLDLRDNLLSGPVPDLSRLPSLASLNLSDNALRGILPARVLSRFAPSSFSGNSALCLRAPCASVPAPAPVVLPSTTTSISASLSPSSPTANNRRKPSTRRVVLWIAKWNAAFLAVVLCVSLACCYCCTRTRRRRGGEGKGESGVTGEEGEEKRSGGAKSDGSTAAARNHHHHASRLVFFDEDEEDEDEDGDDDRAADVSSSNGGKAETRKRRRGRKARRGCAFELEELLRASAELLGKGNLGTVYRAVLEDGWVVAVKRLRDANPCPRRQFEAYMDLIGRLRQHPNVVPLRAYYYARREKLLVYDYLPNGTLHDLLLLGGGGGGSKIDGMSTRGKAEIVLGVARGLAHMHEEYRESGVPHGNVRSANVLMGEGGEARVADFGLALLLDPGRAVVRLGGYRAPEQGRLLSQEADVYAFGIVALEVASGREVRRSGGGGGLLEWARGVVEKGEEGMEGLVKVGLKCARVEVEARPRMVDVVMMIEDLFERGGDR